MKICPVCEKNIPDHKDFCSIACELEAEEMDKEIVKVVLIKPAKKLEK